MLEAPLTTPLFIALFWQSLPSSLLEAAGILDESDSTAAAHSSTSDSAAAVCEQVVEVSKDLSTTPVAATDVPSVHDASMADAEDVGAAAPRGAIVGRGDSHAFDTTDAFVRAIVDNAGTFLESLTDVSPEPCATPSYAACGTNLSVSSQAPTLSEALRAEAAVRVASTTEQPPGTPFAQRAQASLLPNMRSAATLFVARSTDTARVSDPGESLRVCVILQKLRGSSILYCYHCRNYRCYQQHP